MAKTDRRILRTRRMLREALIELIPEKSFDGLTIRDITERADVAYATFFRHYDSKEELLGEQIEMIVRELEEAAHAAEGDHLETEGVLFFNHAQANESLYRSLLGSQSSRAIVTRLKEVVVEVTRPHAEAHYQGVDDPDIPLEVAINHIAAAVWELVAWWLDNQMPYSPERMALIYEQLVVKATWLVAPGSEDVAHA